MVSHGASNVNVTFVIPGDQLLQASQRLHQVFFEKDFSIRLCTPNLAAHPSPSSQAHPLIPPHPPQYTVKSSRFFPGRIAIWTLQGILLLVWASLDKTILSQIEVALCSFQRFAWGRSTIVSKSCSHLVI